MLSEEKARELLRKHGEPNPSPERVQSLRMTATAIGDAIFDLWREERRGEQRRAS